MTHQKVLRLRLLFVVTDLFHKTKNLVRRRATQIEANLLIGDKVQILYLLLECGSITPLGDLPREEENTGTVILSELCRSTALKVACADHVFCNCYKAAEPFDWKVFGNSVTNADNTL